ncbi:hypothetical protein EfmAA55_17260 [Enterococcus faecium]|nr:hypothetical protein EfmAA55_17260 [Enterococcus faecium]
MYLKALPVFSQNQQLAAESIGYRLADIVVFYTQIIRFKTNYSIPLYIFYIITNYICKVLKLVSNVGMLKLYKFFKKSDNKYSEQ